MPENCHWITKFIQIAVTCLIFDCYLPSDKTCSSLSKFIDWRQTGHQRSSRTPPCFFQRRCVARLWSIDGAVAAAHSALQDCCAPPVSHPSGSMFVSLSSAVFVKTSLLQKCTLIFVHMDSEHHNNLILSQWKFSSHLDRPVNLRGQQRCILFPCICVSSW